MHLTLQTMQTKSGQCLYMSRCSLGSGWVLKLTFTFSGWLQLFCNSHLPSLTVSSFWKSSGGAKWHKCKHPIGYAAFWAVGFNRHCLTSLKNSNGLVYLKLLLTRWAMLISLDYMVIIAVPIQLLLFLAPLNS